MGGGEITHPTFPALFLFKPAFPPPGRPGKNIAGKGAARPRPPPRGGAGVFALTRGPPGRREFDELLGLDRLKAIHLNDSKGELGSRVDRHEHIGRGQLGTIAFRHILKDRNLRQVPMYLETKKGMENGESLDVINLRTLREI